ncbi:MAG: YIP1 family protein [Methanosarcinales archaeon]|nr:YIP1 family protein [Methanosarcinales archaeon]
MVLSIGERIKGFLFSPSDTFDASMEDTLGDAFKYYVVILMIPAVLSAIIIAVLLSLFAGMLGMFGVPAMPFGAAMAPLLAVGFFVAILIGGIIGVFIDGLWLHLWVYLVGGRNGIGETIKAVMYGATPSLLLGWIPIVNFIALIWALIVGIIGVRQLQELSTGKAVLAVIIAIAIPLIIYVVIFAAFMAMPGPVFQGPTGPGFGGF